jgi:hypothetical protein
MSFENRKSISKKLTNGSEHKCSNQLLFSTRTEVRVKRCSRPLCSSQSTGGTHPADNPKVPVEQEKVQKVQSETLSCSVPVPQDPTACNIPTPPKRCFPSPTSGSVLTSNLYDPYQCQCSTHERQQERSSLDWLASMFPL